ncbi:major facilitator superfamily domain-containing protein [Xylariomycetidae sp. FL0641]|nr:major facilitator superfamily domain-containing protein [Xylariomycetidae sp. FL0641]
MADTERDYAASNEKRYPSYEDLENTGPCAHLPAEHRQYLLNRHGTLELDPVPTMSDADPYNWPGWKKVVNLILIAFHACMSTFTASSIIPAYEHIAEDLGIELQQASYLTSLQIAVIGGAPLFWRPLSSRFGRRPIFLLSLVGSLVFNVGCAEARTYGALCACRALQSFFICPATAIGSAVVVETFFKHQRARYMGIWTVMVTIGVPLAPFIFGFVAQRVGYVWIFWTLAIINGVQLVLYLFLGPETRFLRHGAAPAAERSLFNFARVDPTPFSLVEFVSPLRMAKYVCVMVPACAYAMVFLFASVLTTVEIPQLFAAKFGFGPQALGLQFLGLIVGSLIGEQIGGRASDWWMTRRRRRHGGNDPEFRLWLSYAGYLLTVAGVVVFLVRTQQAPAGRWNVTPVVGAGIAAAGNQIVTTVLITYAIDCYPDEAAGIGVFITLVRQIWGFIGPFWFPDMFESVGVANSAGIAAALVVGVSFVPTILLQWKGLSLRGNMSARD